MGMKNGVIFSIQFFEIYLFQLSIHVNCFLAANLKNDTNKVQFFSGIGNRNTKVITFYNTKRVNEWKNLIFFPSNVKDFNFNRHELT